MIQDQSDDGVLVKTRGGDAARRKTRDKLRLLSQGAYGCIYKPGMTCKGAPTTSKMYVSKLQKMNRTAANEIAIGRIVAGIPGYQSMYAAIVQSCPVHLTDIAPVYLKQCKVAHDATGADKDQFTLNKIKYAGSETLESYLDRRAATPESFVPKFAEMHLYLLRSLRLLNKAQVVHFDLKENNVVYDADAHVPMLIDFGLSIDVRALLAPHPKPEMYASAFYVYYDKYPPWCLEIVLCSYLIQTKVAGKNWMTTKVVAADLLRIVDSYYAANAVILAIAARNKDAVGKSRLAWRTTVSTLNGLSGKAVVDKLIRTWASWDSFGISVVFLFLWDRFALDAKLGETDPTLAGRYYAHLANIVLSLPDARPTAGAAHEALFDLLSDK